MANQIIYRVFAGDAMQGMPESFNVGGHVQIWGRIQSREYQKKISEDEIEKRIAYEVSVSKLEYVVEEATEG